MSGTLGGVDASIPLRAGVGTGQGANQLANNPLAFIDAMTRMKTLQLLPGQLQLQQQELQSGQQTIESNATKLGQLKAAAAANYLRPLLGQANVSHDDVVRALGATHGVPGVNTDALLDRLAAFQPGADGNYRQFVNDNLLPSMSESGALTALTPALTPVGAGGSVHIIQQPGLASGQAGVPKDVGSLTVTPTQSELMQPVTYNDATNTPQHTNLEEYNRRLRAGEKLGPATPDTGGSNPLLGGVTPGVNGQPGLNQPAAPTGRSIPGAAPGTTEAATASGQQFAAAQTAAGGFTNRVLPLRQAIDLLNDTDTGPGSETLNHFRSVLISLANQGLLPKGITPNDVSQAKFDELKKYMAQYITGIPFAGGSDARMAEAISGSPNAQLATLANRDIAKVLVGVERYRQAQYLGFAQAAQAGQFGPTAQQNINAAAPQFGSWVAKFNTQYDPRAFAVDLMGGPGSEAVKKVYNSLNEAQQKRFLASYRFATGIPGLMQ